MSNIPIPAAIQPFKPFGTALAAIEDGAGVTFYAVLGGIDKGTDAEKRASFFVRVWREKGGVTEVVPLENPPNNAPSFCVKGGALKLVGILESPTGVKTAVERDVPGFVAPPPIYTPGQILGVLTQRLADEDDQVTLAVIKAVAEALLGD